MSWAAPQILLKADDYDTIRFLAGNLGSDFISNEMLLSDPFIPYWEARVISSITDWVTLAGANKVRLRTGVMYSVAAGLCVLLQRAQATGSTQVLAMAGFTVGPYREQYATALRGINWAALADSMLKEASGALGGITTREWSVDDLPLMMASGPRRAGNRVPTLTETITDGADWWLDKLRPDIVVWIEEYGISV